MAVILVKLTHRAKCAACKAVVQPAILNSTSTAAISSQASLAQIWLNFRLHQPPQSVPSIQPASALGIKSPMLTLLPFESTSTQTVRACRR